MIPAGNENSGGRRKSNKKFLVNDDLGRQPKEAKITGVKYKADGKFGPQIEVKIAIDGESRFYTVSKKNPNYDLLVKKFGREENDWVGERILLGLEYDDYEEQYFARVSFPATETTKKAAKA